MKQSVIHTWDVHEIVLYAEHSYENPYTDVTVWAQLKGPGFDKRVYGFWDGGNTWKIRVTATEPGTWTYTTGASVQDGGLVGHSGGYFALGWTEEEKQERNHFFQEVMDALKDHDESGYYITREIKVHERSEKEVASEMGITIGNLRVKMTRTKKWLCQHFADKARERGFL